MSRWDPKTDEQRFLEKTVHLPDGCWRWTGATVSKQGHGVMWISGGGRKLAHRFAYENYVGPIPEGMQIHHECTHGWCVNPKHLTPHLPGMHRFVHRSETCRRGHLFDKDNTHVDKRGNRHCRACDALRHREVRAGSR